MRTPYHRQWPVYLEKRQYDLDELVMTAGSAGGSIIIASGENIGYKPLIYFLDLTVILYDI